MDKTIVLPDKCVPKETVLLCDPLPVHIHQAMAPYEVRKVRKQEMVGKELNRSKKGIHMLNEILNSMNLPAALENITGGGVPASLREKNATGMNFFQQRPTGGREE